MSKLIVSGCSFADNLYTRDFGFTTWPELLADKLGMECINLGASGAGNDYILSSLMEVMFEKDIGLMIAMWSEFERIDFQLYSRFLLGSPVHAWGPGRRGWTSVHMHREQSPQYYKDWKDVVKNAFIGKKIGTLPVLVEKSLRIFYTFQILMEKHKIPYLHLMGTVPCDHNDRPTAIETFFRSIFMDKINENKFVEFGTNLGIAFQIRDDILNLTADGKYGKEYAGDLIEGKRTLILIHLLKSCNNSDREFIESFFNNNREFREGNCQQLLDLISKYKSLDYATNICNELSDKALTEFNNIFSDLPETRARLLLNNITKYMVSRNW